MTCVRLFSQFAKSCQCTRIFSKERKKHVCTYLRWNQLYLFFISFQNHNNCIFIVFIGKHDMRKVVPTICKVLSMHSDVLIICRSCTHMYLHLNSFCFYSYFCYICIYILIFVSLGMHEICKVVPTISKVLSDILCSVCSICTHLYLNYGLLYLYSWFSCICIFAVFV